MKKILVSAAILFACSPAWPFQLSGFDAPESAVRDPETGVIYVSNINGDPSAHDGNGYISRINSAGTVVIQKFIGGKPGGPVLDAPKGLTIWAGLLVVTDIDKIRLFDKKKGDPVKVIDLAPQGAVFLNDLTVDADGMLYISDMLANKIYLIDLEHGGEPRVLREGPDLGGPNGLVINPRSNNLLIVTWNTGSILELDRSGRLHVLKRGLKNLDGVDYDDQWNLYVSSFSQGEIYRIPFLGRGTLSVFASGLRTPADIRYDHRRRELLVPHMESGVVESIPQVPPAAGTAGKTA